MLLLLHVGRLLLLHVGRLLLLLHVGRLLLLLVLGEEGCHRLVVYGRRDVIASWCTGGGYLPALHTVRTPYAAVQTLPG